MEIQEEKVMWIRKIGLGILIGSFMLRDGECRRKK